jgi:ornithine cyclodeaminase/alanine dehydrogenase
MTLLLDEADVRANLDMSELVSVIESGLAEEARGELAMPPRLNIPMKHGLLRVMPVAMNGRGLFGFKVFHTSKTGARYLVAVYEQEGGELLALVDGDHLTAARTGATAGVGAKYLAREDSSDVGVIGAGEEARTNLAAINVVRPVERVRVFSPREARRERFADEVREQYGIEATAVDSPEAAVTGADIAIVATNTMNAPDPIAFRGEWTEPGMHVSSIGSTMPILRELDVETFARADLLVVDVPEQMEEECGDVIAAVAAGVYGTPLALSAVVAGERPARTSDDAITLFKSVGTAMQDVAAAFAIYEHVRRAGGGRSFDLLHLKAFPQSGENGSVPATSRERSTIVDHDH